MTRSQPWDDLTLADRSRRTSESARRPRVAQRSRAADLRTVCDTWATDRAGVEVFISSGA
jgi:hypothetical protein